MHTLFPLTSPRHQNRPLLFLAGSIEMGRAVEWQQRVIQALHPYHGTVLNPRRKKWNSSWEQSAANPPFRRQVIWELTGIQQSDIVAFYFDPATKSPVTLLELGLSVGLGKKVLIACPEGFWRKGNVDVLAAQYGLPVNPSLESLIRALQDLLSTIQTERNES